MIKAAFFLLAVVLTCAGCSSDSADRNYSGWANYGGTKEMIRYSSLSQIDTTNISQLRPAWVFHTGDADSIHHSQMQCNPLVVNGTLYGVSPQMRLFAIDAATGELKWRFDANAKTRHDGNRRAFHSMINSRGVAYWSDGAEDERIFFTAGASTFAIDARTGKPIPTFGEDGSIDLHKGLGRDVDDLFIAGSSPGMVYKDLLIMGMRVDEAPPAAPGHIRAYDVRSGEQRWIFHTIPQPGEYGYETWEDPEAYRRVGGANVWSGFSLDEERGILYAGTGSAAYDFYGGDRKGENLFANCILALDASTGQRIWHYQVIKHDVWDRDLPTPPALVTVRHGGRLVDAVAQPTKSGYIFLLNRETGEPLFEVEEKRIDTLSDLAGEKIYPLQPVPKRPLPFARETLTAADINPYLPDSSQAAVRAQLEQVRYGHQFLLPGLQPMLLFPGFDGGAEWGGPAYDPETGYFYVNANESPFLISMKPMERGASQAETWSEAGQRLYTQNCMSCHGPDRKGTGNNPTLLGVKSKYQTEEFVQLVRGGRRMMPAFARLHDEEIQAIASFVLEQEAEKRRPFTHAAEPGEEDDGYVPYKMEGYTKFLSPEKLPAISPPWGTLTAINLHTGDRVWQIPLGDYEVYKGRGLGAENYGGPVVTAGGLLFIGATPDSKLRAFNKYTGKLLWEYDLPASAFATPAMYELDGRQYLVIACGGGKLGTRSGDAYIAFALPSEADDQISGN